MVEYLIVLGLVFWAIADLIVPIILVTGIIAAWAAMTGRRK